MVAACGMVKDRAKSNLITGCLAQSENLAIHVFEFRHVDAYHQIHFSCSRCSCHAGHYHHARGESFTRCTRLLTVQLFLIVSPERPL